MTHALQLRNISKSYTVVKKLERDSPGDHLVNLRGFTRFFLGESFSILGTRIITTVQALDDVSFTVEPGKIVGLFGKNGSGKTTMLSILGGIFPPDRGQVTCFGYDFTTELYKVRQLVVPIFGWLNAITWAFTGRQNIEKLLILHHVEPGPLAPQIDELAREIDLYDRLDDRAARYSQGMRIKIQIIVAILLYRVYGCSLLLLDEPFIGLDIFTQRYLRDFIQHKMRGENFTMILATHQPADLEMLCDEVIVLDNGRVKAYDTLANLAKRVEKTESIQIAYRPANGHPLPAHLLQRDDILEESTIQRNGGYELRLKVADSQHTLSWLIGEMMQTGHHLSSLQTQPMAFEDVLVQLLQSNGEE